MPQEDKRLIIRVDHSQHPNVPNWLGEAAHPDWERAGPTEYNLGALTTSLHDRQNGGCHVKGHLIYTDLQEGSMLQSCLSLLDGQVIQAQVSAADFQRLAKCKCAALWKSLRLHRDKSKTPYVPFIIVRDGKLVLSWYSLDWYFDFRIPALRFPESMLNT